MSRRRTIIALALGSACLTLVGLGLRDWPIESARATAYADRAFEAYGIALTGQGPARLSLLPLPHLTLDRIRLALPGPAGATLADGGPLTIDLDLLGLLSGRASIDGAALDGARLSRDPAAWAAPAARLSAALQAGSSGRPRRLALTNARFSDGRDELADLDLDLGWPLWSAAADLRASLSWRGVPARIALTGLRPAELAAGRRSPFALDATWAGGTLSADGTADLPAGDARLPALTGRARFEARSLPEILAWLGADAPLAPLVGALTLEGRFESAGRAVSWPSLHVGLGGNSLEGAGSLAYGGGGSPRLSIQATLAADRLNLAPLAGAVVRLFEPEPVPLALAPATRADLDLRLSAASGRVGPIQIQDLAASVLVRESSVEMSLNRARIQDGMLKGRLVLTSGADPAETETRLQVSFDRLDLGTLLGEFGEAAWMKGPIQGLVSLESGARDGAGLLDRLAGRAAFSVEGGTIAGLDLADVIHRNGVVAPGALARRNGRTSFERAAATLRFSDGVGEIADAGLRGAGIAASLQGHVFLRDRRVEAVAEVGPRPPADPSRGLLFAISGPWTDLEARLMPRNEPAEPAPRAGEAPQPGPISLPAALAQPGAARAYAP